MWEGITSDMLLGILEEIKSIMPVVVPTVVGFLAFRKGWSFLKSQIAGAQYAGGRLLKPPAILFKFLKG